MGADITIKVQTQRQDGLWHNVDDAPRWTTRSYDLFACLVGVRDRGYGIAPILPRRSPPADLGVRETRDYMVIRTYYDAAGNYVMDDEGGLYWGTLQELLDFDWSQQAGTSGKSYAELAGGFRENYLEALRELGTPDSVRLIMTFSF